MKTIIATAFLFFIAGACFACSQPTQQRSNSYLVDILTYNNVSNFKTGKCNSGPKLYTPSTENLANLPQSIAQPSPVPSSSNTSQTFTPNPLVNYYKEFR